MATFDFNPIWSPEAEARGAPVSQNRTPATDDAPLPYGLRRLRVDRDGQIVERRWRRLRGLLNPNAGIRRMVIDLREHEVEFPFVYRFEDGAVGYRITVRALVRVTDHHIVAREGVRSVRARVVPALGVCLDDCLEALLLHRGTSTVEVMTANCSLIQRTVKSRLVPGTDFPAVPWLRVTVIGVDVDPDEASNTHRAQLIASGRLSETRLVEIAHDQRSATAQIQLRSMWSDYLEPRLATPLNRAIERIASDPSAYAVTQVARELENRAADTRDQILTLLNKLIDRNFVADVAELHEIRSLVERLHHSGDVITEVSSEHPTPTPLPPLHETG